jgi:hypothetical protein
MCCSALGRLLAIAALTVPGALVLASYTDLSPAVCLGVGLACSLLLNVPLLAEVVLKCALVAFILYLFMHPDLVATRATRPRDPSPPAGVFALVKQIVRAADLGWRFNLWDTSPSEDSS